MTRMVLTAPDGTDLRDSPRLEAVIPAAVLWTLASEEPRQSPQTRSALLVSGQKGGPAHLLHRAHVLLTDESCRASDNWEG